MPTFNAYFEDQLVEQFAIQLSAGLLRRLLSGRVELAGLSAEVLP